MSHRYAIHFSSLLLTIGITPLLALLGAGDDLLRTVVGLNILAGSLGFESPRARRLFLPVGAAAIAVYGLAAWRGETWLSGGSVFLWTALALLSAARAVKYAMRRGEVTSEHLFAGLSAYLVVGVFFGVLYSIIDGIWPDSIVEPGDPGEGSSVTLASAVYFSFVTLATLGYGDVLPGTEVCRGLAILEAVGGQLYVAVLIASLVGSFARPAKRGG
jgi:voltage-gated potassium channel Kch